MSVVLLDTKSHVRLRLQPWQVKLFLSELAFTRKRRATKGMTVLSEPACLITVSGSGGRKQLYQLYDRTVLFEPKSNQARPFYFGIMLMEWLLAAQPRLPPQKPFNPVP